MQQVDRFIRERRFLKNVSPATISWHTSAVKKLPCENPTQEQLNDLVLKLREDGLKATGVNAVIRSINAYLKWSGSKCKLQLLKEPKRIMPTFTAEQVKLLVGFRPKSAFKQRLHLLILILLDTGCRISEALGLKAEDINMDDMLLLLHCKGDRDRQVPFSFQLRKAFCRYAEGKKGPLFLTSTGKLWKRIGALRAVQVHCRQLGFEPPVRTVHAIRHTFAGNYIRKTRSILQPATSARSFNAGDVEAVCSTERQGPPGSSSAVLTACCVEQG